MKLNNLKEKFLKTNFVSGLKISSLVSLCIILIAVIIVSIFNFNLGIDFTGGKIVDVKVGSQLDKRENYEEIQSQIETIFNSEGFKIKSIQLESTSEDATVVVKFVYSNKINSDNELTKLETLKTKLSNNLTLNETAITSTVSEIKTFSSVLTSRNVLLTISAVLTTLAITTIYLCFRFKLIGALTILSIAIHDVLLMLSITCLTRIEINTGFLVAIGSTLILSLITSVVMFDKLKDNKSRELYKDLSSESLANLTIIETFNRVSYITLFVFIIGLAMLIIGTNPVRLISLPLLVGILCSYYSTIMLKLPLWSKISKYSQNNKEK